MLECIGHGDLQGELNRLSKERKWQEMGTLIDDNLLHHFAVVAEPSGVVPELLKCCGGLADRTSASFDFVDGAHRADMIRTLRAG